MQTMEMDRRPTDLPEQVIAWAEEFRSITEQDEELRAHGAHYTCSFLLDLEERRVVVRMDAGRVARLAIDPGPLDERYQFAIRASADTWKQLAAPIPAPMYHGIWAATFRRDMKLEGDLLVLMQNLRAITRHLELLRTTGVPLVSSDGGART